MDTPLRWMGQTKKELAGLSQDLRDEIGHALRIAQQGGKADDAISEPTTEPTTETTMQTTTKKTRQLRPGDISETDGIQIEEGSGNVFADLGLPNADERLAKSRLAALITDSIRRKGWTQAEAAKRLDTHQPTISALRRGRLRSITYDRLVNWVLTLGHPVEIRVGRQTDSEPRVEVAIAGR